MVSWWLTRNALPDQLSRDRNTNFLLDSCGGRLIPCRFLFAFIRGRRGWLAPLGAGCGGRLPALKSKGYPSGGDSGIGNSGLPAGDDARLRRASAWRSGSRVNPQEGADGNNDWSGCSDRSRGGRSTDRFLA
jgi:hypothetical protein